MRGMWDAATITLFISVDYQNKSNILWKTLILIQRDAHDFMRFLFYFWSFGEIADMYFFWVIAHRKKRNLWPSEV